MHSRLSWIWSAMSHTFSVSPARPIQLSRMGLVVCQMPEHTHHVFGCKPIGIVGNVNVSFVCHPFRCPDCQNKSLARQRRAERSSARRGRGCCGSSGHRAVYSCSFRLPGPVFCCQSCHVTMTGIRKRTSVQSQESVCGWVSSNSQDIRFTCPAV